VIRVLLADDHAVVRYGLRALLQLSGVEIVAEAEDGRQILELAHEHRPDVAILDLTMPGLNGIDAALLLREHCPKTRVIMLSMHGDREHVHRAFASGARGYVIKGSASDEIVAAVRAVHAGRQYLSRELTPINSAEHPGVATTGPLDSLSGRERQVLQLVVEGHSSVEIAALVHLSPKSVDTYRSRLMRKLGVADVTALVKFAVQHGLTPGS
jgi:DNA-binding NarL/FixJ family response regulator